MAPPNFRLYITYNNGKTHERLFVTEAKADAAMRRLKNKPYIKEVVKRKLWRAP